jgi:acetyl-CoA carboxylase carboxyltransferase component
MMGPGFAAPAAYASLADFVPIVRETGTIGVAGPPLVKAALGVDVSKEELGGADVQTAATGVADLAVDADEACLDAIEEFLSYLPQNASCEPPKNPEFSPPYQEWTDALVDVVPQDPTKGYDVFDVIRGVVDRGSVFELKPRYARNFVTAFARVSGRPVGLIANNPRIKAGTLDVSAAEKASHFISMCDAFGLPLVFLADTPGTLPGPNEERNGIARHMGKMIFEIGRSTVPKISIVLRRAYGFGGIIMAAGRATDNELTVVWPTAEIAAMGIEGAVDLVYGDEIAAASDPDQRREELVRKFVQRTGAIRAVEHLAYDAAIDPLETRTWIARALERSEGRIDDGPDYPPKKHCINPV